MSAASWEYQHHDRLQTNALPCINDLVVRNPVLPAWHDAPTVPGLWVVGSRCLHINELDLPIYKDSHCRWYGPIPEDKP